jgi:hypothetical protein
MSTNAEEKKFASTFSVENEPEQETSLKKVEIWR